MDSLVHADMFFFITSIAVVLLTAILVIALVYLVRILRDANEVAKKVKAETQAIAEDIDKLRANTKAGGVKLRNFVDFFSGVSRKKGNNRASKGSKKVP